MLRGDLAEKELNLRQARQKLASHRYRRLEWPCPTGGMSMAARATRRSNARLKGFAEFVQETMEAWKVPGLAVGVVREGEVLFLEGFGMRDVEGKIPVTPRTLFALASGTKAFTTMALGMLA